MSELIIGMGDVNEHFGGNIDGFQGIHRGSSIGEVNQVGRMLFEFCDANTYASPTPGLETLTRKR